MQEESFSGAIRSLFGDSIAELCPEDGLSAGELERAEEELGFRIPQVLREFYLLTGNSSFNQSFNRFLLPGKIKKQGDMAIFCEENQCVVYYGYRVADAGMEDPEVWQLNPDEKKWYFDCKRMTSFLLKMICWQAVCGGVSATAKGTIWADQYRELAPTFKRVEFGEADNQYDLRAFTKGSVILCAFPGPSKCHVFCGSNNEAELRRVAGQIGLDLL